MATIKIEGSEAGVTLVKYDDPEYGIVYGLECDEGVWCPRDLTDVRLTSLAKAMREAVIHADHVAHP